MEVDKEKFYQTLNQVLNNKKGPNSLLLTREKYFWLIDKIKTAKTATKKSTADYRRLKKYEVVDTPEGERLYAAQVPGDNRRQKLVHLDEMYDLIADYHVKLNHGGRSRMMIELKRHYKNITTESVLVYLSMCEPCKKKLIRRGRSEWTSNNNETIDETFNETASHFSECSDLKLDIEEQQFTNVATSTFRYPELYSRGQIDILGVTNEPGDEYKYLMVYRYFISKYIALKAMRALSVEEAVDGLLDIFLTFGAPNILQSKNGLELIKPICRRISKLFPEIKVLASEKVFKNDDFKGKSNEDILKKLNEWLVRSQNTKWQEGVKFVQYDLNTTFHEVLCKTPCEMVFGQKPSKGVTSFIAKSVCDDLLMEQDLITVFENRDKCDPIAPKQLQLEESLMLPCNFIKLEAEMIDESEEAMDSDEINV